MHIATGHFSPVNLGMLPLTEYHVGIENNAFLPAVQHQSGSALKLDLCYFNTSPHCGLMLEQPTCLVQLSPTGRGDSRRPAEEGEVKGRGAVSPAHLLNDTPGTPEGPVGLNAGAKGGDTDTPLML